MSSRIDAAEKLIIVDTCVVLDLVRSAERHDSFPADVGAARRLNRFARDHPDRVAVAICDVTLGEFGAHVDGVSTSTRNSLASMRKKAAHAEEVARHAGLGRLPNADVGWDRRLADRTEELARAVLRDATVIDSTGDRDLAFKRAMDRRPPARQGSASAFDCIITECALRVASTRQPGSTLLVTSNRRDFGDEGQRLHPDVETEFVAAGLEFATTWSETARWLGLPGPPNTGWSCDRCGEGVSLQDGFVVWAREASGEGGFRLIHRAVCDPGNRRYTYSQQLADFVGPDGLSYLMSFLSLGPIKIALGESRSGPLVSCLDEFVDFVRRIQVPGYDRLRSRFGEANVLEQYADWNESDPYQRAAISRLLEE